MVSFAAQEIQQVLENQEMPRGALSVEWKEDEGLGTQAYRITFPEKGVLLIEGGGDAGLMYGGIRLAELIRIYGLGAFDEESGSPYIRRRGLKMDITLDARTLGYDDTGDCGQANIPDVWDFSFWKEFLDEMARHHYNALTIWHPHPFPVMLKLEKYPGVAMGDVYRTTRMWPDNVHPRYAPDDVMDHVELVKEMSVDEKIKHWQKIMKHARDRGIEIYFITWNIHIDGAKGKHGIDPEQDNEKTIEYVYDCVKEFVDTYPDLTGIGVTAGEMMEERHDEYSKEKWLWRTYGKGIVDALADDPDRSVRFIHRFWQSGMETIIEDFTSKYPYDFEMSFKYVRGRMYSGPNPPFANAMLEEIRPYGIKSWWNLRNDDLYNYRWGDPEFARAMIKNIPLEQTAGYHMGSDGYLWVRNYFAIDPDFRGQLEIHKHWYNFMMWGRLGYDPGLDRTFFEARLKDKYPEVPAALLYDTWASVSRIITQVNQFHWRDWDFVWNFENCSDIVQGFHSVETFLEKGTMEGSGMDSIPKYVRETLAGIRSDQITPPDVVETIRTLAGQSLKGVTRMRERGFESPELGYLLMDIETMSHLGLYYANKIEGATNLAFFRETGEAKYRMKAVGNLEEALAAWSRYGDLAGAQYLPQRFARNRKMDWEEIEKDVERDIEIARNAK